MNLCHVKGLQSIYEKPRGLSFVYHSLGFRELPNSNVFMFYNSVLKSSGLLLLVYCIILKTREYNILVQLFCFVIREETTMV